MKHTQDHTVSGGQDGPRARIEVGRIPGPFWCPPDMVKKFISFVVFLLFYFIVVLGIKPWPLCK